MNKKYRFSVLAVTIFFAVAGMLGTVAPAQAKAVQVIVNGQAVIFPDQQPFINQDNRTLVPVRAPMEAAGASVSWNDETRQVTVAKGDKTAVFTIGSRVYTVNGKAMQMDTTAQIVGNRTVFPIRFVAEAIGLAVGWNAQTNTVAITSTTTPETQPGTTPVPENTNPLPPAEVVKPMTSLTPEAKARLMAYPYPAGVEIYTPMGGYIDKTYAQNATQSALDQKALIKSNQCFYFDSDLCFCCSGAFGNRVRGVLQTQNSAGIIIEQDVEFGYEFGTFFVSEGGTPQPSHLLEGNDFITLSPPVRL